MHIKFLLQYPGRLFCSRLVPKVVLICGKLAHGMLIIWGKRINFLPGNLFLFGNILGGEAAKSFQDKSVTLSCSEAAKTPVKRWWATRRSRSQAAKSVFAAMYRWKMYQQCSRLHIIPAVRSLFLPLTPVKQPGSLYKSHKTKINLAFLTYRSHGVSIKPFNLKRLRGCGTTRLDKNFQLFPRCFMLPYRGLSFWNWSRCTDEISGSRKWIDGWISTEFRLDQMIQKCC